MNKEDMLEAWGGRRGLDIQVEVCVVEKQNKQRSDVRKCGGHWDDHKRLWLL
jgi:hypothetical protein